MFVFNINTRIIRRSRFNVFWRFSNTLKRSFYIYGWYCQRTSSCDGVSLRWLFCSRYPSISTSSSSLNGAISKKHLSTTDLSRFRSRAMWMMWLRRLRNDSSSELSVVSTTWTYFGHESGSQDRLWTATSGGKWSRPSRRSISARCPLSRLATWFNVAVKYSRRLRYL